jgi:uncharacterized membrane protein
MRQSLVTIPLIHILVYLTVGLDLPVFRQIIVFIYLTFVPGFILLNFIKLKETRFVDTVLFSIGLSIAFLMLAGFFINELLLFAGIAKPLSTIPLEITLSTVTLFLFLVGYRRELFDGFRSWIGNITISEKDIPRYVILLLPILFGVIGALYVSVSFISVLFLSFMIVMVAAFFVLSALSVKLIPFKFYPLMIFAISIALALHILLISKYIIGYDAQLEFQIFELTIKRGYWTLLPSSVGSLPILNYNSMLSLTVLPSIYSVLLNVSGEVLSKTLYPFIFSLIPVVLYRVYEQQMGKTSSLLSTLFLISSPLVFYGVGLLSQDRQIVAMFFLVLSTLVLLDKVIAARKRVILFSVFGVALIVSHYSTGYLYLGLIFFTYVILRVRGKKDEVLNGTMVSLLFVTAFAWYSITGAPLTTLVDFVDQVYSRFSQDIASTAARSPTVFASHSVTTFASVANWVLFVTVHCMIFFGILVVIFKPNKAKLDPTYRILLMMSAIVLFLSLAIPNVAPALDFSRFYQLSLWFLAPCFVFGGQAFVDSVAILSRRAIKRDFFGNTRKIGTVLVCGVLVCYFLSQSGFVNFITKGAPASYSLDFSRFINSGDVVFKASFYSAYIPEQNFFSAAWLSKYVAQASIVYADYDSLQTVLFSYGSIYTQYLPLSNTTAPVHNSVIYLSRLNVEDDVIISSHQTSNMFNLSEISPILKRSNLIYSNGKGEIWQVTSKPN